MSDEIDIVSRLGVESDRNFILATWIRAYYYGNDFEKYDKNRFMKLHEKIIKLLLYKPSVQIKIACLKSDPDVILGYSVIEDDILHFVFIKEVWRKMEIMNHLGPFNCVRRVSHLTRDSLKHMPKSWIYDPLTLIETIFESR